MTTTIPFPVVDRIIIAIGNPLFQRSPGQQFTGLDVTWKKVVKAKGFWCNTYFGFTQDSYFVADTLGNAVLNCQIKY